MAQNTIPLPPHRFIPAQDNEPDADAGGARNHFLINRQSAVPLHIQLKEQVRYAIMSGVYEPGSTLPSIRELTAQLGIHRNTVHRVYLELQASGLLISRPGKGVFVNESLSEVVSTRELDQVDALIERFFKEANNLGINPVTLGRLVGQRAPSYDSHKPIVAFVECTDHQSKERARDLTESFGITVQHLLLEDLQHSPKTLPKHVKHLITSIFHYDEVLDVVHSGDRKVHPITYDLHPATRKLLRELEPGTRLGFICHDANTEEVIGREVAQRAPEGVFIGCANLEAPELALKLIDEVNAVILTEPAAEFCIKHCTPEHRLMELHFALNPASLDKVTRSVLFQP